MVYKYDKYWTEKDIFKTARELVGQKLGDIDKSGWLNKGANKGRVGNMIQEDFFGIKANSSRESDFNYHNIELKVTPILKKKTVGYSSKERLVLGMINYNSDYKISFNESLPMKKTKRMLLIFYLHEENEHPSNFKIIKVSDFKMEEDDLEQVRHDYNNIIDMIRNGQAHEISERQQKFLGACTKGQGRGRDLVEQPFSEILAKSRAYSYKTGFMTSFFRNIASPDDIEHLILPPKKSFLDTVISVLDKYKGKTEDEIRDLIYASKKSKAKSGYFNLVTSMFEVGGQKISNINQTEEFLEEGYAIKTIKNNRFGKDNQDMSFPNLDFTELSYDSFEESTWYGYFAETKYIFILWDEIEPGTFKFEDYVIWTPSQQLIDTAEELYNHVQKLIRNNQLKVTIKPNGSWSDNLPGKNEFGHFQIRPKGTKGSSITTIPLTKQEIKKKCLFLNKEFVRSQFGLN